METTNIYVLKDPNTGLVRYVGKADDVRRRYACHISKSKRASTHRDSWIKGLSLQSQKPILEVIDEVPYECWQFWERHYIKMYKAMGAVLTNLTDGGEEQKKITEETRNKLSQSHIGQVSWNKGTKGIQRSGMKGKKHTIEAKAKMANASRGHKHSEEQKQKISQALKGKKKTKQHSENIGKAKKGNKYWLGKKHKKESIEKRSLTMKLKREAKCHH